MNFLPLPKYTADFIVREKKTAINCVSAKLLPQNDKECGIQVLPTFIIVFI